MVQKQGHPQPTMHSALLRSQGGIRCCAWPLSMYHKRWMICITLPRPPDNENSVEGLRPCTYRRMQAAARAMLLGGRPRKKSVYASVAMSTSTRMAGKQRRSAGMRLNLV